MSLQIYYNMHNYGDTSTLRTSFLSLIRIVCTNSFANMPLHNPAKSIYRIYPPPPLKSHHWKRDSITPSLSGPLRVLGGGKSHRPRR